jgi:hypothetical protein
MDGLVMPMTRRRLLTVSALLLLPIVGLGVHLLIPPKPEVTLEEALETRAFEPYESVLGRCRRWVKEWTGW